MDPTAPEGCAAALTLWAGHPIETAHLRLTAKPDHPKNPNDLASLAIHDRVTGSAQGEILLRRRDQNTALLAADWPESAYSRGYAGESLRRCLRMLFVNFAIGLVEARISPENQAFTDLLREQGFTAQKDDHLALNLAQWQEGRARRKLLWVVAAALIDSDGRVLLAQRPEGKSMGGQWEFPGGKIDEGESPEQALIRELQEELAVSVTESCLAPIAFASHDYDHFHLAMPLFALRNWTGTPSAQEGQRLAWVAKDKLRDYLMPPADIPLIAQLRDWL